MTTKMEKLIKELLSLIDNSDGRLRAIDLIQDIISDSYDEVTKRVFKAEEKDHDKTKELK